MRDNIPLQNALRYRFDNLRIRYPRYSLRAFALKAGVSPATMSLMLKGKRKVSLKLAMHLFERLAFDPQERAEVLKVLDTKRETSDKIQYLYSTDYGSVSSY